MFKIFVGDKPIILTTKVEQETDFKNYLLNTVNIGKVIKELNTTKLQSIRLIHKNKEKLLPKFLQLLPNTIAGGGKVINNKGEVLFIFRNGRWDLPKGRTEKNEPIEASAIREVEEETGVKKLSIIKPLETTYHIFKRHGKHQIKVTHWFKMSTSYSGKLKPEKKEGITKAEWLDKRQVKEAMKNSYANIRGLI